MDEPWSRDGELLRSQVKEFFDALASALKGSRLSGEGLLNNTLTANFCPFASDTWRTFPKGARQRAVDLSRDLWRPLLRHIHPKVVICMGRLPLREFIRLFRKMNYQIEERTPIRADWGNVQFRMVDCAKNGRVTTIAYLPHFSQIKLMRHSESRPAVERFCLAIAESLQQAG